MKSEKDAESELLADYAEYRDRVLADGSTPVSFEQWVVLIADAVKRIKEEGNRNRAKRVLRVTWGGVPQ